MRARKGWLTMAHPPEKRMELRTAYIGGLPLEAAADKVGVPYATARNWFRAARDENDDWDKFQAASLIVAGGGIEQAIGRIIAASLMRGESLLEVIASTENPFEGAKALASLADTLSKLRAASKGMMPEADKLAVAMDVLKRLDGFIRENYPQHAGAFGELLSPFGQDLARAYG